jgi:hypothetical protein
MDPGYTGGLIGVLWGLIRGLFFAAPSRRAPGPGLVLAVEKGA